MERSGDGQWRPLVAALANDRVREVFARLTLGADADTALESLSPSRRRHVVETLRRAGLITDDLRADGDAFARLLASARTGGFVDGTDQADRGLGIVTAPLAPVS